MYVCMYVCICDLCMHVCVHVCICVCCMYVWWRYKCACVRPCVSTMKPVSRFSVIFMFIISHWRGSMYMSRTSYNKACSRWHETALQRRMPAKPHSGAPQVTTEPSPRSAANAPPVAEILVDRKNGGHVSGLRRSVAA